MNKGKIFLAVIVIMIMLLTGCAPVRTMISANTVPSSVKTAEILSASQL